MNLKYRKNLDQNYNCTFFVCKKKYTRKRKVKENARKNFNGLSTFSRRSSVGKDDDGNNITHGTFPHIIFPSCLNVVENDVL